MAKKKPVSDRVQVPLKPRSLSKLAKRAAVNNRSIGKEAAYIIECALDFQV